MSRTLLLNVEDPEERRAVLLEDGRPSLLWIEREDEASRVGNVYKGRVLSVEPSIGAAFVDIGLERPGFLHADDVMEILADAHVATLAFSPRVRPGEGSSIDALLTPGREIAVQVTRDAIAHKGPTLTTHLSLAGRSLVLLPSLARVGVSRRIEDPEARERVRALADGLEAPDGLGWVVRTAAASAGAEELQLEADELLDRYRRIGARLAGPAPAVLFEEAAFVPRAVRELLARSPEGAGGATVIVVDTAAAAEEVGEVAPEGVRVELHPGPAPLFHAFGTETLVRRLAEPRVQLTGGAFLVIHETEALWAIDVNSGRMRKGQNLEETALATDLLAAREIARQIRLRDLGGLIVIDFIDCRDPAHRAAVEAAFREEARKDAARMRMAPMSEFMVLEITRRRLRTGAGRAGSRRCPACAGHGRVRTPESAGLAVLRDIRAALSGARPQAISVAVSPAVAAALEHRAERLRALEDTSGVSIRVVVSDDLPPGGFALRTRN